MGSRFYKAGVQSEVTNAANTEIDTVQRRLESLRNEKRGITEKLITGEIRIKTKEKK